MASSSIKILFLADTHLGFDLPLHPRIRRRRRGLDFFKNFQRALEPAFNGEVDLVVHGGDLFYRSKVPALRVAEAFKPMLQMAERGVPVFIVPGNHERSRIPCSLFVQHPNIHIFTKPKTFCLRAKGMAVSLSGFPYYRDKVRYHFRTLLDQTGYGKAKSDISILCMHQVVEGAKVGPKNYTFRYNADVIRGRDLPKGFASVLSGHIHRAQVLLSDLAGRPFSSPVFYPGSIERTSFAERNEDKGYLLVHLAPSNMRGGSVLSHSFVKLPARPMYDLQIDVNGFDNDSLKSRLTDIISKLDPDGVVRVKVQGPISNEIGRSLHAGFLRSVAPSTMNIDFAHRYSLKQET